MSMQDFMKTIVEQNSEIKKSIEEVTQRVDKLEAKESNKLPTQTVINPRNVNAITLRTGKQVEGPEGALEDEDKEKEEAQIDDNGGSIHPSTTTAVDPSPPPAAHPSTTPAADPLPPLLIVAPTPPPIVITPTPLPDPTSIPSSSSAPPSETVTPLGDPDSSGDAPTSVQPSSVQPTPVQPSIEEQDDENHSDDSYLHY
ncbi:hypothetical protein LR48_Vigan08g065400 [Vigna angularis]|uniref:Uncharacterized protein n=1 Tax=Phaseolus angularis TaxID=3914 RepID=A0A0L9V4F2_PHAAN|nr:hypothetical protein LR48_Vigan08g065400 [Vigna angularis]